MMAIDEIVWETPSGLGRETRRGQIRAFVEVLRTRPGEWARSSLVVANPSTASQRKRQYPGTDWVARRRADGQYDIYGRWVGEQ